MAVTPTAYATAAEYRTAFSGVHTDQDTDIDLDIAAVSRHIDNLTGRFFGLDSAAVARIFMPDRSAPSLYVGDVGATPTSVKIDTDNDGDFTDETALADIEMLPRSLDKDPEQRPFHTIHLPSYADTVSFTAGLRVEVTARWGWPAVPSGIKRACIQLTGILRMQSPRATSRYDEAMGAVFGASRSAQAIIGDIVALYGLKSP